MRRISLVFGAFAIAAFVSVVVVLQTRPGRAAPREQEACLPTGQVPGGLAARDAGDCVTSAITVSDMVVAGTAQGHLLVQAGSSAEREYSPAADTGALSDARSIALVPGGLPTLVAFSVDQGILIVDPSSGLSIIFGTNHPLINTNGSPVADPNRFIRSDQFIRMYPEEGRPHINSVGQYALTKTNGEEEAVILDAGVSAVCGLYIESPGFVPERLWCAELTDFAPKPTPAPQLPATGGGCPLTTDAHLDAAHTIRIAVSRDGFAPNEVTVNGGESYVLILENDDPGVAHSLNVVDAAGEVLRDSSGALVCLSMTTGDTRSAQFVAASDGETVRLVDPIHPRIKGVIHVIPAKSTPTPAIDVSRLTPVAPPSPPPSPITAPADRSPTPAPKSASPAAPTEP